MEVNDLHVGRKLNVSSGIGAAVAGGAVAPSPPAICFTAVSGSAWIENGLLVGNPLAYPSPLLEAQLMVTRAPIQNVTATALSVLKVTNRVSPFAATGTPIDIMLGDVLGPCGIIAYTGPAQPFLIAGKDILFTQITAQIHAALVKQQTHAANQETAAAKSEVENTSHAGTEVITGGDVKLAVSVSSGPKAMVLTPVAGASDVTTLSTTLNTADTIAKQALSLAGKGFDIPHPTKQDHRLRYICLEGPEVGAYIRGTLKGSNTIELPDYWSNLVYSESITVNLTPVGSYQELYVDNNAQYENRIKIKTNSGSAIHCHYTVFGERKTQDKLQVEYKGLTPDDYPGDNTEYALGGWDYARHKGESKPPNL